MLRKAVTIFLILTMSVQSLYKLGLVTWFEVNRGYIATVLCINKAKPELHCDGQCYLKKKMQQAGDETQQTPATETRVKTEFQFFVVEDFLLRLDTDASTVSTNTRYQERTSASIPDNKFRPPSFS